MKDISKRFNVPQGVSPSVIDGLRKARNVLAHPESTLPQTDLVQTLYDQRDYISTVPEFQKAIPLVNRLKTLLDAGRIFDD